MTIGEPTAFVPSAQDWLHFEQICDCLLGGQPEDNLQKGLETILAALERKSGVLFIPKTVSGEDELWLRVNLPLHWNNQIDDQVSQLRATAQSLVDNGRLSQPPLPGDVAGAFALESGGTAVGAVLVQGEPVAPREIPRWRVFLKPLAHAIQTLRPARSAIHRHNELTALQLMADAQSSNPDINDIQRSVLQSLRYIFSAEDVLLVLPDDENPQMSVKKQLGLGDDWIERTSLDDENSVVYQSIKAGGGIDEFLLDPTALQPWLASTVGASVNKVLCAPLIANRSSYGILALVNPEVETSDALSKGLLNLFAATLANAIATHRQTLALKISIADLEASRWEIVNSRNTLRTMFDSIPSSVYIIDRSYTIISINIRRSDRVSRKPSMLVGKKCYDQLYGRSDPCPACRIMETFSNGVNTTRFSREWLDQEKSIEWEITTYPIQERHNLPHQVIILEEDVTEKRNLETNLIQSEKLAAVGQLAAGVAHEINNPLAAIIANAQILKRELRNMDEDTLDALKLIETAGIRASQVVSNLLGIARKEKKYEFELLSLNETILGALSLVHHEVVNHSITIATDLQDSLPEIVASKTHIQGVWINLIVNSIDAIDKPDGHISISTRYADHNFQIIFSDNGKGIPQEQLKRIFEPFFTTKVVGKGTGLGLSVVMRVIKEHQGTIQVESQVGKGTSFIINLPDLARGV